MLMLQPATKLLLISLLALCSPARAEEVPDEGKVQYFANCSGCHGVDGKGAGPLAYKLHSRPSNLTTLAKKNKGLFPVSDVYRAIDGRDVAPGHHASDMPIWGCRYLPPPPISSPRSSPIPFSTKKKRRSNSVRPNDYEEHLNLGCDSEDVIANRILSVVEFVRRIQEK